MALGMEVGLGPGHIVLDGNPAPLPKRGQSPKFLAHFYCGQTALVGLSPCYFMLNGDPAPLPNKGRSSQFLVHVYCGQTVAWIKIPLGTEVGLGLRNIVLDGDPAPLPKGAQPPIFGQCPLWPNGWIDTPLGSVGAGLYVYDVVVKSSRSLSHLLMSSRANRVVNTWNRWPNWLVWSCVC